MVCFSRTRQCAAIVGVDPWLGTVLNLVYHLNWRKPSKTHQDFEMPSPYPLRSPNGLFLKNAAVRCYCRCRSFIRHCNILSLSLELKETIENSLRFRDVVPLAHHSSKNAQYVKNAQMRSHYCVISLIQHYARFNIWLKFKETVENSPRYEYVVLLPLHQQKCSICQKCVSAQPFLCCILHFAL